MSRTRMSRVVVPMVLVAAALGLGVAIVEAGLRLALNPSDFLLAKLQDDPALGHRIAPGTSGHDALGYRNAKAPATSRVVAIGDSHTYGVSAPRDGSWPSHLGGLLGEPVYNMGLGGFGPLQYLHLARTTAKELKPKVIVVAYYFGNDLMDAYRLAHTRPQWHAWRLSAGTASETAEPDAMQEAPKRFKTLRDWLSRHSMLYSVLRATVGQRFAARERSEQVKASTPDLSWGWADPAAPATRTTFRPQSRLQAVDIDRPEVAEGLQIGQKALAEIAAEAARQGARLLVVLIPTKERAYCSYLRATAASMPKSHAQLCDVEGRVSAQLTRFLSEQRIEHADATPALEAGVAAHVQLYPPDGDGHEVSAGYAVIANVVARALAAPAAKP